MTLLVVPVMHASCSDVGSIVHALVDGRRDLGGNLMDDTGTHSPSSGLAPLSLAGAHRARPAIGGVLYGTIREGQDRRTGHR